jgi:hypothetical protein
MRIKTIKTRVIEMTNEEATKFLALVKQAVDGHTVHSASTPMSDGTQLAVTILSPEQEKELEREQAELQQRRDRDNASRRDYRKNHRPMTPAYEDDDRI